MENGACGQCGRLVTSRVAVAQRTGTVCVVGLLTAVRHALVRAKSGVLVTTITAQVIIFLHYACLAGPSSITDRVKPKMSNW